MKEIRFFSQIKQRSTIGLLLGPIAFFTILSTHPVGLSEAGKAILASSAWVAIWWISEALPLAVSSLMPIILFPLAGGMTLEQTTASYGHKFIFLYIGGFVLAMAIERWNLHKRIALVIINIIGTNLKSIILGFMVATAFLSMWISNTATAIMMLPIGLAICSKLDDDPATRLNEHTAFNKIIMIAIAYSASIGGVATLVGTAPNLVLAGVIEEFFDVQISFVQWLSIGLPVSILLLGLCWFYLTHIAFPFKKNAFPGGKALIQSQLKALGPLSIQERRVLYIFIATGLCWILRALVLDKWIPNLDDTIIAIAACVAIFIIPSDKDFNKKILKWEEAVKLPWGILLLFGGGLAIANGFKTSGLAEWVGLQLSSLEGFSPFLILAILVTSINFLTEINSNLATTTIMLPILAPLGIAIGIHPYIIMAACTIAASCAFMLPVATPPNAIVFASGHLKIKDMAKTGVWMNIIALIVISCYVYFFMPIVWDLPVLN